MKKYWFLWACGVVSAFFLGQSLARADENEVRKDACNQKQYDFIYKLIMIDLAQSNLPKSLAMSQAHESVEALRSLCNGQVSSYEK